MRNLDLTNPQMAKPSNLVPKGAAIPIVFALIGMTLASDAAPSVPFFSNPVFWLNFLVVGATLCLTAFSVLNRWDWNVKYFGSLLFHIASVSLIFVSALLCVFFYSRFSFFANICLVLSGLIAHIIWNFRFIKIYRKIYNDKEIFNKIYEEEEDAIYYMQQIDKKILQKKFHFNQFPSNLFFIIFMFLALPLLMLMGPVTKLTGMPFIHLFFLVTTLPISLMSTGLATRLWLIYYFYPRKLSARTLKPVYIDMSGKPGSSKRHASTLLKRPSP